MSENNKIRGRDDKLLNNENSWRRARIAAVILALFFMLSTYMIQAEDKLVVQDLLFSSGWLLFWLLIVDWLNMRIRHIASIKHYRKIIIELREEN